MTRTPLVPALLISLLTACNGDDGGKGSGDGGDGPGTDTGCEPDCDPGDTGDTGEPGPDPIPLDRAQAGGNPLALQLVDEHAFVVVGAHLEVWSLEDPESPALVGQTEAFGGLLSCVAVDGSRAYVAERQDLDSIIHVLDLSNPAAPTTIASFRTVEEGGYSVVHDLVIGEDKLYVADQEHGIFVFDLADPDAPAAVTLISNVGVTELSLSGSTLHYVAAGWVGTAFGMISIEEPYDFIGGTSLSGSDAMMVNDLLVATGLEGVQVLAFDPSDPWWATEVFSGGSFFARVVGGAGTTAWIPADDGLHTLDLSDPSAISLSDPLDVLSAGANAVEVLEDAMVVVTDRGRMLGFDVSSPTEPVSTGTIDISLCADCASLAFDGEGRLYIADVAGGLRTAMLSDLSALGRGAPEGMVAFEDVVVDGNIAYVSDWFYGLHVYDVSDPAAPLLLSSLSTGGYVSSVALAGEGRIVLGESTNGGRVHVVDVSDPGAPEILATTTTSKVRDLVVEGDLVFVADEALYEGGGLRIFDIGEPGMISPVGHYEGCASAIGVALATDTVVLACASEGFHLVDISDPSNPAHAATVPTEGVSSAWSVATDGDRAYLGQDTSVIAIDISDPSSPAELERWPVAYTVRGIGVPQPGRVVAAVGLAGVYQWELEE